MKPDTTAKEPAVGYHPEIHSLNQLDMSKSYSYADYFRWKFKERVELYRGFIHKMSPAPGPTHQSVSFKTGLKFGNFFEGTPCTVFAAPFDVRLPGLHEQCGDEQIYTVVQPDLCVICDLAKIDKRGCLGPPDLVVEVLSPGNTQKEMGIKFRLYEENGIKEYWLVHPVKKTITVYSLQNEKYTGTHFWENEEVRSVLFPKLKFRIGEIFDATLFARFENIAREPEVTYAADLSLPVAAAGKYTYSDYLQWGFKSRVELIRGTIHPTAFPRGKVHELVGQRLRGIMEANLKNKPFTLLAASAEIRFSDSNQDEIFTVVRPDLAVVFGPVITDDRGVTGSPDLVIEILSSESASTDAGIKYKLYEEHAIQEYWLVDPEDKAIFIHVLQDGKYVVQPPFTEGHEVNSSLFPKLRLGVSEVFG